MMLQSPVQSFYASVSPRCVRFGFYNLDVLVGTESVECPIELTTAILDYATGSAYLLHISSHCVDCIGLVNNGLCKAVAAEAVYRNEDISV